MLTSCYISDKHFVNSNLDNQHFILEQKTKYVRNFRIFTVICISDFQVHCERLSFYEDGISGTVWKLFQPSPWVAWIGLNAFVHVCWVTMLFGCQLYQVSSPWVAWKGLNAFVHVCWVTMLFGCQLYQVSKQTSPSFTVGRLDKLERICS